MSDPWKADEPIREENFINESERDSVNPENDEYKVVKLESNGRFSKNFIPGTPLAVYDLETSGTWEKPDFGSFALVFVWGSGGGGGAYVRDTGTARVLGGAGGGLVAALVPLPLITESVSYTIGQGGDGGFVDTSFERAGGNNGASTSFGNFIEIAGGNGAPEDPDNNSSTSGNDNASSDFGFQPNQLLAGGRSGQASTSSGGFSDDAPNQEYQGAGAGAAMFNPFQSTSITTSGGLNKFLNYTGGDGVVSTNAVGEDGETTCGGGAALDLNEQSAQGGKGGDGYIRIYII